MSEGWDVTIDPEQVEWDVVVVGAGMGGGTIGHALAKRGRRVLFVEKGPPLFAGNDGLIRGRYAEEDFDLAGLTEAEHLRFLERAGRSTDEVEEVSKARPKSFTPFIGSGTGGSSALYGMICERLFPADFEPRSN